MTPAELKEALHTGRNVFGTLIVSPSPFWPKVIGDCGLDFVFIDTEHIGLDRQTVSWMCRAYAAMGLPPLVRIPNHDPNTATVVLDDGAAGVIVPYVETPEVVRKMSGATKLRPLKGQRLEHALGGQSLEPALSDYMARNSGNNLLIVNIESVPAMQALDEILPIAGLDAVLIGPHDLSTSLGIPEQYDDTRFLDACEQILGTPA
ncbi:MAG: aldolase/citrate lyase family protein [Verrucomicrobia bacterium]|nr:aldolase/citrate lyase family protein [Verrucomicrobiota bacterium]